MYLPLAGLIGLGVVGGHAFWLEGVPGAARVAPGGAARAGGGAGGSGIGRADGSEERGLPEPFVDLEKPS